MMMMTRMDCDNPSLSSLSSVAIHNHGYAHPYLLISDHDLYQHSPTLIKIVHQCTAVMALVELTLKEIIFIHLNYSPDDTADGQITIVLLVIIFTCGLSSPSVIKSSDDTIDSNDRLGSALIIMLVALCLFVFKSL